MGLIIRVTANHSIPEPLWTTAFGIKVTSLEFVAEKAVETLTAGVITGV